jgi:predicted transcriptional regulator
MGYLNRLQERLLEGIIDLSKIYDRPVKSDEVASYLGIHPGSVRNAISALKVLGLIESRSLGEGLMEATLQLRKH